MLKGKVKFEFALFLFSKTLDFASKLFGQNNSSFSLHTHLFKHFNMV